MKHSLTHSLKSIVIDSKENLLNLPLGYQSMPRKHGHFPSVKCTSLSKLSVLPAPEPKPFRGRFEAVSGPFRSRRFHWFNRIASRPQSDCKKPAHGGMQNFALRRVLVFYNRIEALMQSDCKKPMETTTSKRPRNDFETTPTVKNQYTAECKIRPGACPHQACKIQ